MPSLGSPSQDDLNNNFNGNQDKNDNICLVLAAKKNLLPVPRYCTVDVSSPRYATADSTTSRCATMDSSSQRYATADSTNRAEVYLESINRGEVGDQLLPSPLSPAFTSEEEDEADSSCTEPGLCQIGLLERLIRTHPVWYLPGIQRAGAFHLLQGKEQGNFVVRQSSQNRTMALSVRLPPGKGPYIEHYLIEADDEGCLSLESSDNKFHSIPALIAHYSQCCDELPVELCLPRIIREARTRQQLSSLALLGQEFWRYPMANPRSPQCEEDRATIQQQPVEMCSSAVQSPVGSLPSSQASSLSSFGSGSIPSQEEPLILRLSPFQAQHSVPALTTFKSTTPTTETGGWSTSEVAPSCPPTNCPPPRAPRPTPPNSLDLVTTSVTGGRLTPLAKMPPLPPPRSSKPPTNLTITTTVTFSMTHLSSQSQMGNQIVEYREEEKSSQISPSLLQPSLLNCRPLQTPSPSGHSLREPSPSPLSRPTSASPSPLSPSSDSSSSQPNRRSKIHKQSSHYRESDILESPAIYSQSPFSDKASDYEDIWGPDTLLARLKSRREIINHEETPSEEKNGLKQKIEEKPQMPGDVPDLLSGRPRPAPRPSLFLPPPPPTSPNDMSPSSPTGTSPPTKQSSPFYCEPADAIPRRRLERINSLRNKRHSDPSALIHWPPMYASELQTIDSREELVSTSVDDLSVLRRSGRRFSLVKPSRHSKRIHSKKLSQNNWTIDSSWEFIGHDDEGAAGSEPDEPAAADKTQTAFPAQQHQHSDRAELPTNQSGETTTLHHLIALRLPEVVLPEDLSRRSIDERVSAYDNLNQQANMHSSIEYTKNLETIRSTESSSGGGTAGRPPDELSLLISNHHPWLSDGENVKRAAVRAEGLCTGGAATIRSYVLQLAADRSTVFSQTIDNFIRCTTESRETRPHVVMRNMRQFMSGIKNYLVKHGERDFISLVENQRAKLKANEFLNLDAILEGVLERVVVKPLRPHLHRLFVQEYSASGAIRIMADNIHYARTQPLHHLGIRRKVVPPGEEALEKICCYLQKLQQVDSPLEKLENLLASIATIFKSVEIELGADELLPLFAWVLVQVGMVSAEMEAEYMWGLLDPSLLSGEPGYYLTTLSSAVHVIKNLKLLSSHSSETKSVLRVVVPDELNGSIITKTLPVRPHMTTRELSKIIAHKLRITNPQDYALYRLVDGEESLLNESDCPQDLGPAIGKHCMFAYKRIDAKIAWPISTD